jgi:hypothetical protein
VYGRWLQLSNNVVWRCRRCRRCSTSGASLRRASPSFHTHIVRNALREASGPELFDWSLNSGNVQDFTIFDISDFSALEVVVVVVVVEDDVHGETLKKGANN